MVAMEINERKLAPLLKKVFFLNKIVWFNSDQTRTLGEGQKWPVRTGVGKCNVNFI